MQVINAADDTAAPMQCTQSHAQMFECAHVQMIDAAALIMCTIICSHAQMFECVMKET